MSYEDIYDAYQKFSKEHVNRELFNHSTEDSSETVEDIKNSKIAIYTAFTGDYDTLKEPEYIDENCDYICFSDNPNLKSETWKIIPMHDSNLDNNRKAKEYKILPHKYLKDYKYSFWLDGTFKIKSSIREYIYKYIKASSSMLCVVHTERDCIYDEYDASKIIPRYPRAVMEKQIETYKSEGFPKHYGLAVMGAIFRKHNDPDIVKLMEDWWSENIRFTNQDQLSFAYVAWKNNFHPSVSLIYYWDNEYWSKEEGDYHHKVVLKTPHTSQNLKEKLEDDIRFLDLDDSVELTDDELYLLINDVEGMAGYRIDTAGRANFLKKEYDTLMASNSVKLTRPIRFAGNILRHVKTNPYLRIAKHAKLKSPKQMIIYNRIKRLGLINEDAYFQAYPGAVDPILHFIEFASKNDNVDDKMKYINPIFDLYYYISSNNLDEDPVIHYVREGYFKRLKINRNYDDFVLNMDEELNIQLHRFVKEKIRRKLDETRYITDKDFLINYFNIDCGYRTDTLKVGVFLEDNYHNMNACPFIRIHEPFKYLSQSGDYHFFIYDKEVMPLVDFRNDLKIFDVIVVQRVNPYANEIIKYAKRHDIKIIYELDDDFLNMSSNNPSYHYISQNKDYIEKLAANADCFVVSTDKLKYNFEKLGLENVNIIRNYYVGSVLPLKPFVLRGNERIKIGYFGTNTHDRDLEMIQNVIARVRDDFSKEGVEVELEVIGQTINGEWFKTKKIPYYPMSFESFMKWISQSVSWDIGIVPLVPDEFNDCKSELKYIELTALGVPVIASRSEAYEKTIEDGVTGYLAGNEDEWVDKLSILIRDFNLRNGMLHNAREDILKNYTLKSRALQWDKILKG